MKVPEVYQKDSNKGKQQRLYFHLLWTLECKFLKNRQKCVNYRQIKISVIFCLYFNKFPSSQGRVKYHRGLLNITEPIPFFRSCRQHRLQIHRNVFKTTLIWLQQTYSFFEVA